MKNEEITITYTHSVSKKIVTDKLLSVKDGIFTLDRVQHQKQELIKINSGDIIDTSLNTHGFWAKKFDKVKHIAHNRGMGGVECEKYGALLGNNYITKDMPICIECFRRAVLSSSIYPKSIIRD